MWKKFSGTLRDLTHTRIGIDSELEFYSNGFGKENQRDKFMTNYILKVIMVVKHEKENI